MQFLKDFSTLYVMPKMNMPSHESEADTIVLPNQQVSENTREKKVNPVSTFFEKFSRKLKRESSPELVVSHKSKRKGLQTWHKAVIVVLLVLVALGSAAGAMAYYTYGVAMSIKSKSETLKLSVNNVKDQLKTQNLPGAKTAFADVQKNLDEVKAEYNKLAYLNSLPIGRNYYQDGLHGFAAAEAGIRAGTKTVDAIVPYADVLGFSGEGTFTGGTAEDRIRLLLETLEKVSPVIDDITNEIKVAEKELAYIDPDRYPENFQGYEVKKMLIEAQTGIKMAVDGIAEFRPAIEVLPEIAGGGGKRKKYLVIFQNDNELRPSGGFMTAYAVMFIENGKVTPEKSDDIYELDKKFNKNIAIPPILGKYLTSEKRFNLRDMNIDPDYKTSMDTFLSHYKEIKGEPQDIDGVIAVDTVVLSELVRILGPIDVPGYGTFSADIDKRCDCPQIIYVLSEIVDRPTPYIRENRKGIIAPMMQAILQKAYSSPKEVWPQLFALAQKQIEGKHVQMYFMNEEHQKAAEAVNVAGRMNPIEDGSDYFAIVDANLGGAKSNLFVEQEVKQEVSPIENGFVTKKVTITYKNQHAASNCNLEAGQLCLNGTLNDWFRLYVPEGAEVIETKGFNDGSFEESSEGGFKILEGAFKLAPMSNATLQLTYKVPYTNSEAYKIQLRKQAGTDDFKYLLDIDGHEEEIILSKDQTVEIPY